MEVGCNLCGLSFEAHGSDPNAPCPKVRIQGRHGYANNGDMLELLGLKRTANLPKEGMPERLIQGVRVYVKPSASTPARRSCAHRVIAICTCGQHVPTGRLHQHTHKA